MIEMCSILTYSRLQYAGIYISNLPGRSTLKSVTLNGCFFSSGLLRCARTNHVLEIDLEGAWKEVGSELEWNSGIDVDVTLEQTLLQS